MMSVGGRHLESGGVQDIPPGGDRVQGAEDGGPSLVARVHQLLRGRYLIALCLAALLGAAGAYLGWKAQRPLYRAAGVVLIDASIPTAADPFAQSVPPMFRQFVAYQVDLLQTQRATHMAMESETWRNAGGTLTPEAIEQFEERRTIVHTGDAQHIQVFFADEDSDVALAGLQAILESYLKLAAAENSNETGMTRAKEHAKSARAELNECSEDVLRLIAKYGDAQMVSVRYQEVYKLLVEGEKRVAELRAQLNVDEAPKEVAPLSPEELAADSPALFQAILDLNDLREERKAKLEGLGALGEANPVIQDLDRKIKAQDARVELLAKAAARRRADAATEVVRPELRQALLEEAQRTLDQRRATLDELAQALPELRTKLAREAALEKKCLDAELVVEKMESAARGRGRISVTDRGQRPTSAFKDPRRKYAAFGGFLGICLGFGLVGLVGLSDRRLRASADVRGGLRQARLLGVFPRLGSTWNPQAAEFASHCVHLTRTMLQVGAGGSAHRSICVAGPSAGSGKTTLALALALSYARSGSRTLLIDGDLTGRGLTARLTAVMLERARAWPDAQSGGDKLPRTDAEALRPLFVHAEDTERTTKAELGAILESTVQAQSVEAVTTSRVMEVLLGIDQLALRGQGRGELVDRLHQLASGAGTARSRGGAVSIVVPRVTTELDVGEMIQGPDGLSPHVISTGIDNLEYLTLRGFGTAGQMSPTMARKLLETAHEMFDTVVIDTGPVLGAVEAPLLASIADDVVLVVSPSDRRPDAEQALAALRNVGANVRGIVFNRASHRDALASSMSRSSARRAEP